MIRFGMTIPIPVARSIDSLVRAAQRCENAEFNSIWAADHLLMLPPGFVPEAWSVLTVIATATSKVKLGTAVSDVHRYHPAVFAQKLATVDCVSGGRVVVGLGIGEAMNLDPFGFEWRRKPLRKMVEYVEVLRGLWRGGVFSFRGEFFRMDKAFLQVKPVQESIPIYIAANSPQTRKLTGKLANGWLPGLETPETYRRHLEDVRKGAEKAGRLIDEIDRGLWIYTAIAEDHNEALKALYPAKSMHAMWPKKLEEAGFKISLPEKYPPDYYTSKCLPTEEGIKEFEELSQYVPNNVLEAFSICGTVDEAIGRIEEYVEAGATHFMLINMGPNPLKVLEAYSQKIIPYFKNR